ncbi:MAG: SprT family zinc-dependent metalloprotease [Ghiorsea sp.]
MKTYPFDWTLRLSKRAKRPRLTINTYGIVELVWPHRMSQRYISNMLQEHTDWLMNHLSRLPTQTPYLVQAPENINLLATQQNWGVVYEASHQRMKLLENDEHILIVQGNYQDKENLRRALNTWVKKQGQKHLKPWLASVANEMDLNYSAVSIRLQKKRWGSCSAKGGISLNAALLFLPDFLVRHVLIHELSHLKHLNHSARFWATVAQFDADYLSHRKRLKHYAKDVPAWLTEEFSQD